MPPVKKESRVSLKVSMMSSMAASICWRSSCVENALLDAFALLPGEQGAPAQKRHFLMRITFGGLDLAEMGCRKVRYAT